MLSSVGINLTEFGGKVVSNLTEFETFMQSKNVSEKVGAKLDEMGFKNFGNRMRKMGHTVRKFKLGKNGKRVILGSDGQPKPTGHEYDDIVSSSGTIIRMFESGARQIIGKNGDIIGTLPPLGNKQFRKNAKVISDIFRCGELVDITGNIRGQHHIQVIKDAGYVIFICDLNNLINHHIISHSV